VLGSALAERLVALAGMGSRRAQHGTVPTRPRAMCSAPTAAHATSRLSSDVPCVLQRAACGATHVRGQKVCSSTDRRGGL
jgi:hypothetical protein